VFFQATVQIITDPAVQGMVGTPHQIDNPIFVRIYIDQFEPAGKNTNFYRLVVLIPDFSNTSRQLYPAEFLA
jgi:hypothetical protein